MLGWSLVILLVLSASAGSLLLVTRSSTTVSVTPALRVLTTAGSPPAPAWRLAVSLMKIGPSGPNAPAWRAIR